MNTDKNHLLWIHQHPAMVDQLTDSLKQSDFEIISSSSSAQALDVLEHQPIDVILLDGDLPESAGNQILKDLKTNNGHQSTPVLVVGSPRREADVEAYLKLGADDILLEVHDLALLKFRIDRCLQSKRLQTELEVNSKSLQTAQRLADDFTKVILPIGVALSEEKNFDILLRDILLQAKALCNADGGTLYLREENLLRFSIMVTDSMNHYCTKPAECEATYQPLPLYRPNGEPNMRNVASCAALNGLSINIPDVYETAEYDFSGTRIYDEKNNYRTKSCLTVPLKNYDNEVIGVLQMLNALSPETKKVVPFNAYKQHVIEALASQASIVLNNRMLIERQKELLLYEHELQIGHDIQAKFLPDRLPQLQDWEIAAHFQPARQISGDFYDAFELMEGRKLAVVIGDVCDKGVGAALFMASVSTLFRSISQNSATVSGDISVRDIVQQINDYLFQNYGDSGMFVTIFFGIIDVSTGMLEYANGGHNPPVIIRTDREQSPLPRTAPFIGAIPGIEVGSRRIQMNPGDVLFAFTDGVTEANGPDDKLYSEKRLTGLLSQPFTSTAELLDHIEKDLKLHIADADQADDITMIAVKRQFMEYA